MLRTETSTGPQPATEQVVSLFVSHASEDKVTVARPLALALKEFGFQVWFDEFEIVAGDRIRQSIERGLTQCDYGVVILSPSFFHPSKYWTTEELEGLSALESLNGRKRLIPIWHELDASILSQYSPSLAGRRAIQSSIGTPAVADEVRSAISVHESRSLVSGLIVHSPQGGSIRLRCIPNPPSSCAALTSDVIERILSDFRSSYARHTNATEPTPNEGEPSS